MLTQIILIYKQNNNVKQEMLLIGLLVLFSFPHIADKEGNASNHRYDRASTEAMTISEL